MSGISVENYSDYTNRSKKLTRIKSFVSVIVKLMTSASMIKKKARKRSQDIHVNM